MCGIAGFLDLQDNAADLANRMISAIHHRGPDSQETWTNDSKTLALAHARLAIVDLAPTGAQPMESHSGRFVIAYNGEIYNHVDIRDTLNASSSPPKWRGSSDTETLLAAIDHWGLEKSLEMLIGMFAFALWDIRTSRLTLVRDRYGEKPLYYQPLETGVIFGSELSSLEQHPKCSKDINKHALVELCTKHSISAPQSIYKKIYKLLPGTLISFQINVEVIESTDWWSPISNAIGHQKPWAGTEQEAIGEIESKLSETVKRQMFADVPLGAFLSGGIDSTLIVALMQQHSSHPVETFTIGFDNPSYNEAPYAKKISKHLGTSHTEHYVNDQDIVDLVPTLGKMFSEPLADSSQIPTYLISHLARQSVTVALTGDAGDEIFGGYNRHSFVHNQWPKLRAIPYPIRKTASSLLGSLDENSLDKWLRYFPGTANWTRAGEKFKKSKGVLLSNTLPNLYDASTIFSPELYFSSSTPPEEDKSPQSDIAAKRQRLAMEQLGVIEDVKWIMLQDQMKYLPNDILAKVDRASMASSLETRAPFLDHTISEFTQTLPASYFVSKTESKTPLRRILNSYVPAELFERPKMGFAIPLHDMLRGPLKDWVQFHLSAEQLAKTDCFDVSRVRALLAEHLDGKNHINALWPILSFQAWHHERSS